MALATLILPHIGAGDDEMLVCGMALGYADTDAAVNTFPHAARAGARLYALAGLRSYF